MKKIILLTFFLLQITFMFGQENKWGPWNNSDCYPKIQFRAKLVSKQYYNGGSTSSDGCNSGQGYQWKVQVKNNYGKIVWINFSAGNKSCVEKAINDGAGLNLKVNEVGEISLKDWYSDSIKSIYVLIKSMAFLKSNNDNSFKNDPSLQYESCESGGLCQICRIDESANHCPEVKTSKKVNVNDAKKSLSVEELENSILKNLKQNLTNGKYFMAFKGGSGNMFVKNIDVLSQPALWWQQGYGEQGKPHTLYVHYNYNQEGSGSLDEQYTIISKYNEITLEKINFGKGELLKINDERNPMIYNFGTNDENFIELQNAIEALKKAID